MTVQALKESADALLREAAQAGDVPGVVAMATGREGTLYEGAFGTRALGQPAPRRTSQTARPTRTTDRGVGSRGSGRSQSP